MFAFPTAKAEIITLFYANLPMPTLFLSRLGDHHGWMDIWIDK
jgi:hypothetical protein